MKRTFCAVACGLLLASLSFGQHAAAAVAPDPDAILAKLMEGNRRFAAGKMTHPHQAADRRAELAKAQHPIAVILACADSRVPPELLFDQGLGDLFVIRLAGNIADDDATASIEYAAEHLGTSLVVVLGHKRCGAVGAAVQGGEAAGHLPGLLAALAPAVSKGKAQGGDLADNVSRLNASIMAEKLRTSKPVLSELGEKHKLKVVAAYYDLDSGAVTLLK